jgi:hypothetical protein
LGRIAIYLFAGLLPLVLTPVFGFLLAEGHLDLGGGEKDLIWVLPWALWALVYAISFLVLWARKWPLVRGVLRSSAIATLGILLVGLTLALLGQLGVGGRF